MRERERPGTFQQPEFGQTLRALRLGRQMSQADLAEPGMSTAYLSRLESGQRPPTEKVVQYLADRLGIPVSGLSAPPVRDLDEVVAVVASGDGGNAGIQALIVALRGKVDAPPAVRWHALWVLGSLQTALLEREAALATWTQLASLGTELANPVLHLRALNQLALCHRSMGDIAAAYATAAEALEVAQASEIPAADAARAYMVLISTEAELGRLPDAQAHATELRELTVSQSNVLQAEALWTSATISIRQGDNQRADELLRLALERHDSHTDLTLWLRLRLAAASLYLQMSPPRSEEAAVSLAEAATAISLAGSALHRRELLLLQAQLHYSQGDLERSWAACIELEPAEQQLTFRDRVRLGLLRNQIRLRRGDSGALKELRDLAMQAHNAANIDLAAELWRVIAEASAAAE